MKKLLFLLIKEFLDALHRGITSLPLLLDTSQLCCGVVH